MADVLFGETGGQHPLARWVDHEETYGSHVISRFVKQLKDVKNVVDIGAGSGRDLSIVQDLHPAVHPAAIEAGRLYAERLRTKVDQVHILNIERDRFPFEAESVDLYIANQVLEHTKEVFWIFDQISTTLRVGGHFILGVPNIASLHNRILLLFGAQPTQHKLCSAHVRPFSKRDTLIFLNACFPEGYELVDFAGSQFYPLPAAGSRLMAGLFPKMAFSIFFLLKKTRAYRNEFAKYPARAKLETNFWTGQFGGDVESQYD